jgi:hypothetical protein
MAAQPTHTIRLSAKYKDASDLVLSPAHHRTLASMSAATQAAASAKLLLGSTMPMPMLMDLEVGLSPNPQAPTSTSTKLPHTQLILTIDDDADTTDIQELTPKLKKSKKTATQAAAPALQTKALIIKINDNDNLKNKWLNKSNPTADIKEFFVPIPCVLGQDKAHMLCKQFE